MQAPVVHLSLPFFDDAHRELGSRLSDWMAGQSVDESDDRLACRRWVRLLGDAGWLRYCVPAAFGGALEHLDSRALVILRETLAFHSPLADFAFAMQGLGSGAITLAGSAAQRHQYLGPVARGEKIAAFALSEAEAGSDVGAMASSARFEGPQGSEARQVVLEGSKPGSATAALPTITAYLPGPGPIRERAASPLSSSTRTHRDSTHRNR